MLCVSRGERTEAELLAILEELSEVDGFLSGSPDARTGVVTIGVTYDDGSIQESLDQKFGKGLVVVESALKPV